MAEIENKFIVAKEGGIGKMRIFNEIDSAGYTLDMFLHEFESLQNDDSVTEIEILINSLGGSVFKGFPIITAIKNSEKPVTTIVDTVAASMGAMIFLAGQKRKMYSYSQLMIHAARYSDGSTDDALVNTNNNIFDILKAVTRKAKDKIKSWLSKDTWFTAEQALENNLATEIIRHAVAFNAAYQSEVRQLVASGNYNEAITNNLKDKYSKMENILNELELENSASQEDVAKKIKEMKAAILTKEEELKNRNSKIEELKAKLDAFEQAEKTKRENEIDALVNTAFENRQINAEGKATWKNILAIDFENGKKAIEALAKTEKLSDVINTDENKDEQVKIKLSPIQELMQNPL